MRESSPKAHCAHQIYQKLISMYSISARLQKSVHFLLLISSTPYFSYISCALAFFGWQSKWVLQYKYILGVYCSSDCILLWWLCSYIIPMCALFCIAWFILSCSKLDSVNASTCDIMCYSDIASVSKILDPAATPL